MNETILTQRHITILSTLSRYGQLSREKIARHIQSAYPVSKATLARDLAYLLQHHYLASTGKARAQIYLLPPTQILLQDIPLQEYFKLEADQRKNARTTFDADLIPQLHHLLSQTEMKELDHTYRSFSSATTSVDEHAQKQELERFVIELAWKSSKIEGNTYSLLETERLLQEKEEAFGHSKQEATMILNHKNAFEVIVRERTSFQTLSIHAILEIHRLLTKDLGIDGSIRKYPVGITGTTYRPPGNEWQIREYLEKIITAVNDMRHPLEKGIMLTSMIAYLQPFVDGNKRTARMLTNAVLLSQDYFPLSYRSIDEIEYKSAQILFYETHSLYHIKRLFLEQYRFALQTYFV